MHDRPTGKMIRCSKARAMFAMRACRKSIMIGNSLNKIQMTSVRFTLYHCLSKNSYYWSRANQVIRHMGTMDQPWHCPHGRPTMRHLSDISTVTLNRAKVREARKVDWATFTDV